MVVVSPLDIYLDFHWKLAQFKVKLRNEMMEAGILATELPTHFLNDHRLRSAMISNKLLLQPEVFLLCALDNSF